MKRVRELITCLIIACMFPMAVSAGEAEDSEAVEAMARVWNIEGGGLAEGATHELWKEALALAREIDNDEIKTDLYKMAVASRREMIRTEIEEAERAKHRRLYGTCKVTHYCNCSACCGQWAGGGTASGTYPTAGRTVAMDLPFGTQVEINGHVYIVEDRGVSGMWVDIYCDSHGEALSKGMYYADVYIIG